MDKKDDIRSFLDQLADIIEERRQRTDTREIREEIDRLKSNYDIERDMLLELVGIDITLRVADLKEAEITDDIERAYNKLRQESQNNKK